MILRSAFLLFVVATLITCSKKKKEFNGILKPSNITSQFFIVNPSDDTTINTSHAARLVIKKGTFLTDDKVTVEIKEVFRPEEILLTGLTTLSNGKLLASAGMLYFSATVNGKNIEPSLPVKAFIPGNCPDPNMKIFSGEIQSDSSVNWVNPKEIARDTKKPDKKANTFDNSTDTSKTDCMDTIYISKTNTFPEYNNYIDEGVYVSDTTDRPRNYQQEGYEFEVTANGWYNIDAFLKEEAGIENVKMSVEVKSEEDLYLNMYLFIPTERVLIASSDNKNGNQYFFSFNEDKTIPLPLRHRAIVLGFNSVGKRIMYGAAEFTIEKEQVISMELKEISKRALTYLIASKNLNGIEIEAIEKEMQIIPCNDNVPAETNAADIIQQNK